MKKLLALTLVTGLVGCGGGGGGDSSNNNNSSSGNGTGTTNAQVQGVYTGTTNQGQTAVGVVDSSNKVWFLYSPPYSKGVTGFIAGDLNVSGSTVKSTNAKDYYFGGATQYSVSIDAIAETKKNMIGDITYNASNKVGFNATYDSTLSAYSPTLTDVFGTYNGTSAIVQGVENAVVYISSNGAISGRGTSGCTFTGNVTPQSGQPYLKLSLIFGNSPCYMAGRAVNGIVYFDKTEKTLYAAAENSGRDNAVLFLGVKQ